MATESPFGVSCNQLKELMGRRGKEGEAMLSDYEGVEGLAAHLKTDLKLGVSNDRLDLEARRKEYGANAIPPVKPKPFLLLAFEALQVCLGLGEGGPVCVMVQLGREGCSLGCCLVSVHLCHRHNVTSCGYKCWVVWNNSNMCRNTT